MSVSQRQLFGEEASSREKVVTVQFFHSVWQPRARIMRELVGLYEYPQFIRLKPSPPNANVRTGQGLGYGDIYFSSFHLEATHLPLHLLIHYFFFWYKTSLRPMQLHLNAIQILSYALSINREYNWGIGLVDMFRCYKLLLCWKGVYLYTLALNENGGSFLIQHKTTKNDRKMMLLLFLESGCVMTSGLYQSSSRLVMFGISENVLTVNHFGLTRQHGL